MFYLMGCIKRILGTAVLKDYPAPNLEMELNESPVAGHEIVHLQTVLWRIELSDAEFKEFAMAVCDAGKKLREVKFPSPTEGKLA
jgi:hypothetical protein